MRAVGIAWALVQARPLVHAARIMAEVAELVNSLDMSC
jgi:hypothetical protein